MSNIKVKDYLNEQRFILATGSGTDADPYIVHHISRLQDGTGSPIASGVSAPGSTERGLVVRNIPSGSHIFNLADYNGASVGASNAVHVRPGVNETFPVSGAVTITGVVDVKQGTASALNLTATQGPAGSVSAAWPFKLVTSSGDPAMNTATSSVRVAGVGVFDIIQATASALNATVHGFLEVRQSNASALQVTAEVRQATASALQATVTQVASPSGWTTRLVTPSGDTAMDTGLSAARVYVIGGSVMGVEVRQSNASALRATAEIYQAVASALNATVTQNPTASGWTARIVTPSGDTAMDTANSALRVNLVAGGAGTGAILDGVQSNLPATVVGYAGASPLTVRLTDTDGNYVAAGAGTQYTEDAATAANPVGGQLMGRRRDSLVSEVSDDGDVIALNATSVGELHVRHLAAIPVTDNGGTLTVDGSVSIAGVVDVKQGTASALNATVVGAVEVRQSLASALRMTGEIYQAAPSALRATAEIYQGTASALNATVVGAVEVRQSLASALRMTGEVYQSLASALNVQTVGELAHDAVDAGNPVKFGGKALEASPTNVSHLDRVNAYFDKAGRQFVRAGNQSQDFWSAGCAPGNGNIRATVTRANSASGTRLVCTGFTVTMAGGSAAPAASNVNVQIVSGTSLWVSTLAIPAVAGANTGIVRSNLWIVSPQASPMSIEFLSSGGVNVLQSVSMEGTTLVE